MNHFLKKNISTQHLYPSQLHVIEQSPSYGHKEKLNMPIHSYFVFLIALIT